jgi:alkanesulfonate monooxygenase SsuD/methylene tetrahydromethanopterin reductase-like flavin-dependent oxidoreductase (luciferase family)
MQFGLLFELQTSDPVNGEAQVWREGLEQAELAERSGFDAVWAVEHHFLVGYAHCSAPEVFLTAVSQRTSKVRLGHGVVVAPAPVNHPFRLAERVAALDLVSGGRVDVGFGRGFSALEQTGFGLDPETSREMAAETVESIPKMWTDEEFPGYQGKHLSLPPRRVIPKPAQKPHPPMWWACTSPPSFELAGKMGLGCLCFAFQPPEVLTERLDAYRQAGKAGTPVGAFANTQIAGYTVSLCLGDDAVAKKLGAAGYMYNLRKWLEYIKPLGELPSHRWYAELLDNPLVEALEHADPDDTSIAQSLADLGYCAIGNPDACIGVVKRFQELGIDQLLLLMQTAGVPHEKVCESIRLFGEEVIPACR